MTYREYATMDRLMQGITPAPVEYIAEELGGEKFKTVCDDIYAVLKENELSVEQAEVMLEVVKARLKKIYAALAAVQSELKAPKGQMNTFGGYRYRSCEDILEAVKPILKAHDLLLTLSDEPKVLEGWHYIEATAKLESLDTPIADRRRCEPKAIQSAVRRAAKGAWLTNPEYVQQLAGYPLTGCPSAVQFIEMLYNALVRAV